ncbi:alpha-1A adrenergic receptor-like isoform X2 [Limulus polyphemus]|nr:alpha-1A adrenergic receptor-like isoform X2 [Limulus polyphemus]
MVANLTATNQWSFPTTSSLSYKESNVDNETMASWNGVSRLIFLSGTATVGTMGSIFAITAIAVIDPLQVRGNIYLVSLALANLLVTGLVLPASCIAILASIPHDQGICAFQWLVMEVCFLVSVLTFMFIAMENFVGLGSVISYDFCCTRNRIVTTVSTIWSTAVAFSVGQQITGFGPSLCDSSAPVWLPYHAVCGLLLVMMPILISSSYFVRAIFKLKAFKLQMEALEDPTAYVLTDEAVLKSNIVVFILMLMMWIPTVVVSVVGSIHPVGQKLIDVTWWISLSNSCLYSYVYAATNKDFREAFNKLFYYFCCKSHVSFSRKSRDVRRNGADGRGLRVHIIPGLNIYAQRKDPAKDPLRSFQLKKGSSEL